MGGGGNVANPALFLKNFPLEVTSAILFAFHYLKLVSLIRLQKELVNAVLPCGRRGR